jgi:integrase
MAYSLWLDRQLLAAKTRITYRLQVHQYGASLAQRPLTALELSVHILRHICLTNLVGRDNDLVLVAERVGHQCLETTRRYRLPSLEDLNMQWRDYRSTLKRTISELWLQKGHR